MLLQVEDYEKYGLDPTDKTLPAKLEAIEHSIRKHTNNRFHVRARRVEAVSSRGILLGVPPGVKAGDTVQITASCVNDGLYTVQTAGTKNLTLDRPLLDAKFNRCTLVCYPPDVVAGAVGILEHERSMKGKQNIASESLSRRSVTYVQQNKENTLAGYPLAVTGFLGPYMRACF